MLRTFKTFLFELFSRGISWIRLLVIVAFVNEATYTLIVLLVTAEVFFGELLAYPQVRQALFSRIVTGEPFFTGLFLWLITAPIQFYATYIYFQSNAAAAVVTVATLGFILYKIMIYSLRSVSVEVHNHAKFFAALAGALFFFGLTVPVNPYLYPLCSIASASVAAYFIHSTVGAKYFALRVPSVRIAISGWMHFGTQSFASVAWQYGNRFVAGAAFPAAVFSLFIRDYLLVSGVIFVFSAIMIVGERQISVDATEQNLSDKIIPAIMIFGGLFVSWLIYSVVLLVFIYTASFGISVLKPYSSGADSGLLVILMFLFLVRAAQLVLTPLVVSIGKKDVVTAGAIASIGLQALAFWWLWDNLHPKVLAAIMLSSLSAQVLISALFLCLRACKAKRARSQESNS